MSRENLGQLLRQARESSGLTLVEAQEITGISREMLRRYETGVALPSPKKLDTLFTRLGVPANSPTRQQAINALGLAKCELVPVAIPEETALRKIVDVYFDLSGQRRCPETEFVAQQAFLSALQGEKVTWVMTTPQRPTTE